MLQGQSKAENERVAAALSGQLLNGIRYFLLPLADDDGGLAQWDFGVWHQATMGVEFSTERGDTFSAAWAQYGYWGYGVDLFDMPITANLTDDAARYWVDVSAHEAWQQRLGEPVRVAFHWNDYGTGQPPCPEAVHLSTPDRSAWIIAADWERQGSRLSLQLGTDDLLLAFDDTFLGTLGLFDPARGRVNPREQNVRI